MNKIAIWEKLESYGTEFLEITPSDNLFKANSTVISMDNGFPNKINYNIELNNWFVRNLNLEIPNLGKSLYIETNHDRQWFDKEGNELIELYGAIDIDISCTPFTNSLPINRSKWILNEPQSFKMVFITIPELTLKKVDQIYTLIEEGKDYQRFDYKSGSFHSTIKVDMDGLVIDYPKLFNRIY
ncbi:putative glycolipid-binding domain-containing protein [Microbacteriaceae bacterium 4G12]